MGAIERHTRLLVALGELVVEHFVGMPDPRKGLVGCHGGPERGALDDALIRCRVETHRRQKLRDVPRSRVMRGVGPVIVLVGGGRRRLRLGGMMLDHLRPIRDRAAELLGLRCGADLGLTVVHHQRARADEGQRLIEVAVDEIVRGILAGALHAVERRARVERIAHGADVLGRHLVQLDLGGEAAILADGMHVMQHEIGVVAQVGQERDADDLLQLGQIDVVLASLERLLGDDGEELVKLGTHEIAPLALVVLHRVDGRARVEHAQHPPARVRIELLRSHLGHEARYIGDGAQGLQRDARGLEGVGQQRVLDDGLELLRRARLEARHVRQRRAHGVGAEEARHEHQRVDGDGNRERQIGQPIAVLEGVPGDDKAMRLVVAIELGAVDRGAQRVRLLAG